MSVAV